MKILLVEDDREIREMLHDFLTAENFEVICAPDGQEACQVFDADIYSMVLLDLMIPEVTGLDVMRYIRRTSTVPIIIISAKDSETDRILGLELGADDYITKPFSVTEVLARIRSNIRRTREYDARDLQQKPLVFGTLVLNPEDYTVRKGNRKIELTAKEFEILKLLMENPKKVYTKAQIYASVWQDAYLGDENAVNVHISRLRNKIEEDPRNPKIVITVWGIGYRLGGEQ